MNEAREFDPVPATQVPTATRLRSLNAGPCAGYPRNAAIRTHTTCDKVRHAKPSRIRLVSPIQRRGRRIKGQDHCDRCGIRSPDRRSLLTLWYRVLRTRATFDANARRRVEGLRVAPQVAGFAHLIRNVPPFYPDPAGPLAHLPRRFGSFEACLGLNGFLQYRSSKNRLPDSSHAFKHPEFPHGVTQDDAAYPLL
jgi:hypothetical protein